MRSFRASDLYKTLQTIIELRSKHSSFIFLYIHTVSSCLIDYTRAFERQPTIEMHYIVHSAAFNF